ncbi:enoyl-CoA hydratase-related protein [Kineobactrum salinum]|uniref:Enoyl-CoA hydratase n=1 Tax=Kineobactrum salinum TaxID=2708301 RepID=A0A6C0U204_9GAMM|nr:enoyl-CoA hydratase-related protein [Kineobactrum salinum]QIB65948.1 enoyl-CoA hydratase [Kineobactrum salinum]
MSLQYPEYNYILVDHPEDSLLRITLDRPEKRNALSNKLRSELFDALERADRDSNVRVIIIRGAGKCFSAGYDLSSDPSQDLPYHTAGSDGFWPRHVVDGCFKIWDLSKPVIAQVHGYCLAGGSELAAACDLVCIADTAQVGYPPVRSISPPDNQFFPWMIGMRRAMMLMLTGDAMTGQQAVDFGFANLVFPESDLESGTLALAQRVAKIPPDLQQMNKRSVHRQMDAMGMRAGIRAGTEMQALAMHSATTQAYIQEMMTGLTTALSKRDAEFGDYRESKSDPE